MPREAGAPLIIAGGGIGGLTTAICCARAGIPSIVCERRPEFSEDGAGIQIGPNGIRILKALGVDARLEDAAAKPDAINVMSLNTGARLATLPLGRWIEARHGAPYWTAHRKDLHQSLRETALDHDLIQIRLDSEVTTFAEQNDGIEVTTSSEAALRGRALIAADGLWSKLRTGISGEADFFAAGKAAYRCTVDTATGASLLDPNRVHIWIGPDCHVVHYPVRGGREAAIVAIIDDDTVADGWNTAAARDWYEAPRLNWPGALMMLFNSAPSWRRWSLFEMTELKSWTRGRAALLGDAAHPILPFLAQGSVMALEDAAAITHHLSRLPHDTASALRAYERDRHVRVARVASASRMNGRIYHLAGLAAAARNGVMGMIPGALLMARYDWLYGGSQPADIIPVAAA